MPPRIKTETMKRASARTVEAINLLVMLKPLLKRRGVMTEAEQEVFLKIIHEAKELLWDTTSEIHKELYPPQTEIREGRKAGAS